ncbi:hypothetical protein BW247_06150 [Acidihalobacter ferrooxydans]|uniref:Uncharacterized protein n=2 Tax=Acidihalobacter ferrooxydans TaxID=1765967 RepID=A0A1P8UFV4_9GAMM|nr:hypothetical protein BW247_06150 [Acidihalobacter ferrooxydans]
MKPYDMVREGLMVMAGILAVVVFLAAFWGFPGQNYWPLTIKEVANKAPLAFLKRTVSYFDGTSSLQTYGPPFTDNYANAQHIGALCLACWSGVTFPLNAKVDLVMQPLHQIAQLNSAVATALEAYQKASPKQQMAWDTSYTAALHKTKVQNGRLILPTGDYGPVPVLMDGMLKFARAGLLEAALTYNTNPKLAPYETDYTRALLYLGGNIMGTVATHFHEQGYQWGMTHMAGPWPGAWWLWSYSFWYQLGPIANSPNADLIAFLIFAGLLLLGITVPFNPLLRRIPYLIPVYRIIWRDWYARYPSGDPSHPVRSTAER